MIHSTAEYCAPVWCRSAHTRLIDKIINDALDIVTRCLSSTPTDNLFILSGIQPTELLRQKTVLSLARHAQEPEHLLYERLLSPLGGQLRKHKSRHPFVPAALELLKNPAQSGTSVARWRNINEAWSGEKNLSTPYISVQFIICQVIRVHPSKLRMKY